MEKKIIPDEFGLLILRSGFKLEKKHFGSTQGIYVFIKDTVGSNRQVFM